MLLSFFISSGLIVAAVIGYFTLLKNWLRKKLSLLDAYPKIKQQYWTFVHKAGTAILVLLVLIVQSTTILEWATGPNIYWEETFETAYECDDLYIQGYRIVNNSFKDTPKNVYFSLRLRAPNGIKAIKLDEPNNCSRNDPNNPPVILKTFFPDVEFIPGTESIKSKYKTIKLKTIRPLLKGDSYNIALICSRIPKHGSSVTNSEKDIWFSKNSDGKGHKYKRNDQRNRLQECPMQALMSFMGCLLLATILIAIRIIVRISKYTSFIKLTKNATFNKTAQEALDVLVNM